MGKNQITPEKITHPLQLMAAWFVMLVSLVSALLVGAASIHSPTWVPGFLVVSAVGLSILVMVAVFLMLTLFRPHLQGPKEYAEWLKDERRYRNQSVVAKVHVPARLPASAEASQTAAVERLKDFNFFREVTTCPVKVVNGPLHNDVVAGLQRLGFHAEVYKSSSKVVDLSEHEAVWIGHRIPPAVALFAIKSTLATWPHLKYLSLSEGQGEIPPDYVHDELFLGGSTPTALEEGLQPWTNDELLAIPDNIAREEFNDLVRSHYKERE